MLKNIKERREGYLATKEAKRKEIEDSYDKIKKDGMLQSMDEDSVRSFESAIIAEGVADINIITVRVHSMVHKHADLVFSYETSYGQDAFKEDVEKYLIKVIKNQVAGKSHPILKLDNKVSDEVKENLMGNITKKSKGDIIKKGIKGTIGHGLMQVKGEDNV